MHIDGHFPQPGEIDQQSIVANAPPCPGMTAGTYRHLQPAFPGKANSCHDIGLADRFEDCCGETRRMSGVEQRVGARGLVVGAAALDEASFEHRATP